MSSQRGASAVEFALVVPLFFMLVMGMITSGITLNSDMSLTHSAREAARFGATLPTGKIGPPVPTTWFDQIAQRAIDTSSGALAPAAPGQYTCVAYIGYGSPEGTAVDWTEKREQYGSGTPTYTTGAYNSASSWCFDDGLGGDPNQRRVQVVVRRQGTINAVLFSMHPMLTSTATTRYEAASPP